MVTEGELVTENAELITVVDLSTVVFVADVPLRNLREVKTGEEATVQGQSLPGKSFRATVEAISPHADLPSQSVKARLRFRGEGGEARRLLKTEMSGIARIITGVHQGVLIVPKSAILRDDETNTYSIVVVTPDTLARTVPVSVMASSESDVEVQGNGLQPGTLVVVEGNYALADSTKLSVGD
jgi:RND family efflux transporter MFP subunit